MQGEGNLFGEKVLPPPHPHPSKTFCSGRYRKSPSLTHGRGYREQDVCSPPLLTAGPQARKRAWGGLPKPSHDRTVLGHTFPKAIALSASRQSEPPDRRTRALTHKKNSAELRVPRASEPDTSQPHKKRRHVASFFVPDKARLGEDGAFPQQTIKLPTPQRRARSFRRRMVKWQMATARASVVSRAQPSPRTLSRRRTMKATCSFSARPVPTTDFLTSVGS